MFLAHFTESAGINGEEIERKTNRNEYLSIAKEIGKMKLQSRQDKMKHFSSLKFHATEKKQHRTHNTPIAF